LKPGETLCRNCSGKQRVTCACCAGRGRVNGTGSAVLPSGEWPQWCPACRGGGLEVCALCLGEGVRRRIGGY
jgi:DnaJ-class molecular chaperone